MAAHQDYPNPDNAIAVAGRNRYVKSGWLCRYFLTIETSFFEFPGLKMDSIIDPSIDPFMDPFIDQCCQTTVLN
jgi:hypothetical protein